MPLQNSFLNYPTVGEAISSSMDDVPGEQESRALVQLVCGPIGNLGDITYRAVESLKKADLIACEDTRHSRRLLNHYDIHEKSLISLHEHNESHRAPELVQRVSREGIRLAVISDAGAPTISDPGFRLVRECAEAGVKVEVLPGASAVITGLVGSGLPTDSFFFGGFLPVKSGRKTKALEKALGSRSTAIFFESPHRISKTLRMLADLDANREACVARELTKKFETYHRGTAIELAHQFETNSICKGEITLLIRGISRAEIKEERARNKQRK